MKTISSGALAESPACDWVAEEVLLVGVEQESAIPIAKTKIESFLVIQEDFYNGQNKKYNRPNRASH
ncbi:hypothetical protein IMPR6_100092 [Imperialibacter sp. EC-SDR9]|nr:hypothetical protein IMPERIA89_450101 [Imperialibacter sp. 89]CAD5292726.1 hypothetical protein IMPERIA75_650100 [Imperialibacter sp. 75]VVS99503.1 hypothetical protein IMPR6_100092 [Imperialibacter sp. EC-SDR9]